MWLYMEDCWDLIIIPAPLFTHVTTTHTFECAVFLQQSKFVLTVSCAQACWVKALAGAWMEEKLCQKYYQFGWGPFFFVCVCVCVEGEGCHPSDGLLITSWWLLTCCQHRPAATKSCLFSEALWSQAVDTTALTAENNPSPRPPWLIINQK